jgi:hypothetical protein
MVVYLSKPMIMRINHLWGYQGWRRYRIVDMCKGKRNYDYEAPMTSSLSDCTWLEKEWKFRLPTTWHSSLHFIFLSLDSSLSYVSYHSSFLFLFFFSFSITLFYSLIHIFFVTFLFFFLSLTYMSYGPPWAHYLGGCQDRLLGGPPGTTRLALHDTWWREAQGLQRRSTRLGSCTCPALYGRLLDVLD